jgi:hypothetical protein
MSVTGQKECETTLKSNILERWNDMDPDVMCQVEIKQVPSEKVDMMALPYCYNRGPEP